VKNIYNPFDWYCTQLAIYRFGISRLTECGPGRALQRNSKFIPGAGQFILWNALTRRK